MLLSCGVGETLESPLDCKEIQPVHPKEYQSWIFIRRTDAEAETPILWTPDVKNWLTGKDPDAGKDWRQEEKEMTEHEMVGWRHWLNTHEFEQTLGDGDGQGNLSCCSPWGHKEINITEKSVQFSCSVVSDLLRHHGLQHTRLPCPSLTPRVYSNSCPLSPWYHPTISSSVISFSSCLQSVPASGFFQMSQFFASGGQSVGVSSSTSVLPMNIQDWFPLGWTGWISLQSKGLSRVFSNTTVQKHQFFSAQFSL